jgi:hypothetical protein
MRWETSRMPTAKIIKNDFDINGQAPVSTTPQD